MNNKKIYRMIGIALLIVAIASVAFFYLKKMPQVSNDKIDEVSVVYLEEIKQLKSRIDDVIREIDDYDIEEWENFTQYWIPKFNTSRPEEFMKRVSEDSSNVINTFNMTNHDMYELWISVNANITKDKDNRVEINVISDKIDKSIEALESIVK